MPTRFNIGTTEWTMVKKEEKRRESGRKISCYKELRNSLRKLDKARKGAANFTIHVGNVDNSFFPYLEPNLGKSDHAVEHRLLFWSSLGESPTRTWQRVQYKRRGISVRRYSSFLVKNGSQIQRLWHDRTPMRKLMNRM